MDVCHQTKDSRLVMLRLPYLIGMEHSPYQPPFSETGGSISATSINIRINQYRLCSGLLQY